MKKKLTIALLFGGRSAEHEVSITSAKNVYDVLDKQRYVIKLLYLSQHGFLSSLSQQEFTLPVNKIMDVTQTHDLNKIKPSSLSISELASVELVFPLLHGTYGEDGTMQGLLQLMQLPFVGSSVLGSAVCMDKDVSKRLLKEAGIPVVPFRVVRKGDPLPSYTDVADALGTILFIKPANLGSSIGVHKVIDEASFTNALLDAFRYDTKLLVETAVDAREIECAVLGNEEPQASVLGEIIPSHEFYSYASKYEDANGASIQIPAKLPNILATGIRAMAIRAFDIVECSGLARVDFFIERKTNTLFINEINTLPGFTDISMYPMLWEATGLSYTKLLDRLIALALERHRDENSIITSRQ